MPKLKEVGMGLCYLPCTDAFGMLPSLHLTSFLNAYTFVIRESVDSLCRDDVDTPMPPCIRKACKAAAFVSLFR